MIFSKHFSKDTFQKRREKAASLMPSNSALLVLSAEIVFRNNDVEYPFRQNSDFWYLTGFNEPNAALLIIKGNKDSDISEYFFVQDKDPSKEVWTGIRAGQQLAKDWTGIDNIFSYKQLPDVLEKRLLGVKFFYYDAITAQHLSLRSEILKIAGERRVQEIRNSKNLVGQLRLFKDEKEIELLSKSAQINNQAHARVLEILEPGLNECEIQAELEYFYRKHGANWSYGIIAAGGSNATILHYVSNDEALSDGDMILIDAGCELEYYASDITRTWPVSGKYSSDQADIYNIVLNAQLESIEVCKRSNATLNDVHNITVQILSQGLKDLSLLSESVDEIIEKKLYTKYYMHKTSHWLGLDVHDSGEYVDEQGNAVVLQEGMAFTIEPGLYFNPSDQTVPPSIRGIGIRIEDNIICYPNNEIRNLNQDLAKSIDVIEG